MSCSRLPKVSVITPMYNAARYIEEAARSVLAQTFGDFEYIIVNDGSTDTSLDIVKHLALEDKRIRIIDLGTNQGNPRATNRGFDEARGMYIALMDADDKCHPERFAKEVSYLDAHPNIGIVGTQYWRMNAEGNVLRKAYSAHGDSTMPFKLLFSVPMCNPTKMFRREILDELMPDYYNPSLIGAADYDVFLRAGEKWKMHVMQDYLFYYRIHQQALGTLKKDRVMEETLNICEKMIFGKYPQLLPYREAVLTFVRLQRDARTPMTHGNLELFLEGLYRLAAAYSNIRTGAEKKTLYRFVKELEVKTLLGRYRLYRHVPLLWHWIKRWNRCTP